MVRRLASATWRAGELSGGNRQKISLAKWLAAETEILIIDEPTAGIDVRTKGPFHELIWGLCACRKPHPRSSSCM
ncbi:MULTISPECIES: ATP-binding cassette domain-containing protein [Nonomuraea]|uniref:ATP-binding cassette domain-containing protein n=1 Tax=Nonomuraea mangrovi TaxID=2316207 RepID=A0ABW4TCR9_9ACTN